MYLSDVEFFVSLSLSLSHSWNYFSFLLWWTKNMLTSSSYFINKVVFCFIVIDILSLGILGPWIHWPICLTFLEETITENQAAGQREQMCRTKRNFDPFDYSYMTCYVVHGELSKPSLTEYIKYHSSKIQEQLSLLWENTC